MGLFNPEDGKFYCECGCGTQIPFCTRFARGHHMRTLENRERVVEQNKVLVRYMHTPEANRKRKESQRRYLDLLSPEESEERIKKSFRSETALEAQKEACRIPEHRARMSRRLKLYWANLSSKEEAEVLGNSFHSEAAIKAKDEALVEIRKTPEFRAKLSRGLRSYWSSLSLEEKAEKIRNNPFFHSKESSQSPNEPEKMLWKFLVQAFPEIFIPDWVERVDIGGKHPDFWTKNGYKLVIESFGEYWHNLEYFGRFTEEELIAHYRKYGYSCIVVWANSVEDIIFEWPSLAKEIRAGLGGD